MDAFLGDTPRWQASPIKQIKAGDHSKFLLIAGSQDNLVALSEIYKFTQALNMKGVYVEQLVVRGRDHGTILSGIPSGDEVARKIVLFLNEDR
jgi:dipeptidyl aminopeptidase/acylaminoacyl peptidase